MYVHSVKFSNFKSFGSYPETELILEPAVTTIIGKNESGKSNVLDGLSRISLFTHNSNAFQKSLINRNEPSSSTIKYDIVIKSSKDDIQKGIVEDTIIEITNTQCKVSGGFLSFYEQKVFPEFEKAIDVLEQIGKNPFQLTDQELTTYRNIQMEFRQSNNLDLYQRLQSIEFLFGRRSRIAAERRKEIEGILTDLRDRWFTLSSMLPTFFYRKSDKHLSAVYKLEDVEKELKNELASPNSLLFSFVKLLGVTTEDFISAARSGTSPNQETLRRRINRLVESRVNKPFSEFYETEHIKLDVGFNSGVISFVVQSEDGEALMLSERSNGLKWYLETYIDAMAHDIAKRNVVYLFDEPGTSLHVNAQKELITMFKHLAKMGNQIVYTTHSPYMLDLNEGIHRIRAVVKNSNGYSYIYKTAYDARIAPESQEDTLAPIINAIGMNLDATFGPALNKVNIVTEGMSDYIFMCTMAKLLEIDANKYAIIPAVGATNCVNICCILHGWGCRYIALFDYDKEGVEKGGEVIRDKMAAEYLHHYCYTADVLQTDVDQKTYKIQPWMIEDIVGRDEIERFCNESNTPISTGKTLLAKLMSNAIEKNQFNVGQKTRDGFKSLFSRIFSYDI